LYESPEVCAESSAEAAELTGLVAGTPVVAGAGDQGAGAVGMGILEPGSVSATIGTSGVVFAATAAPTRDPLGRLHTFCHAVPGRWHVMGVTQAAGLSLRWLRDVIAPGRDYDALTAEAAEVPAGSDGLLWTPYLLGERTPHLDSQARAAFVGLTAGHTRGHLVRAVLEGVAYSLKDTFSLFAELGIPV
jgi:xylulokinase